MATNEQIALAAEVLGVQAEGARMLATAERDARGEPLTEAERRDFARRAEAFTAAGALLRSIAGARRVAA